MSKKYESQEKYRKEKLMIVKASFKKDFALEFKSACKKLGITQAEVIKNAMEEIIEEAKYYG